MADVAFIAEDEVFGEVVETLEVVGGVGDAVGGEAEPFDDFADGGEVALFFGFGVCVVVAEVAFAAVVAGEAEVDGDGLAVADVEVAVGLGVSVGQWGWENLGGGRPRGGSG